LGKKESKKEFLKIAPKIVTTAYNMKLVRKIFLFSYFEYRQIWLNISYG
jgi:hypothetical protein